jgi:hypothetical protein
MSHHLSDSQKHGHLKHGEKEVHTNSYVIPGTSTTSQISGSNAFPGTMTEPIIESTVFPITTSTTAPIFESTVIPSSSTVTARILESSEIPYSTSSRRIIESSTMPIQTSTVPIIESTRNPITSTVTSAPLTTTAIPQTSGQPQVRVYEKTTIEHHNNLKEKAESKLEKAKDKILGFIPNPFSHHKNNKETMTTHSDREVCATEHPSETVHIIRPGEQTVTNIAGNTGLGDTTNVLPGMSSFQTGAHEYIEQPAISYTTSNPLFKGTGVGILEQPLTSQPLLGQKGEIIYTKTTQTVEHPKKM